MFSSPQSSTANRTPLHRAPPPSAAHRSASSQLDPDITSFRTWCSLESSYTRPEVVVFEIIHTRLRKRARRPDILKRSTAPIRHPQTRILAIPSPIHVRIRRMRIVINSRRTRTAGNSSVPWPPRNRTSCVIELRPPSTSPPPPAVDPVRIQPDASHNIRPALWRLNQRHRHPGP